MQSSEDPSSAEQPPAERRSALRSALRGAGVGLAVVAGILVALLGLLQVDAVGTAVAREVADRVAPPGLEVSIDRVSGSWLRSLQATGVTITGPDGSLAARIDTVAVTWSLPALLDRHLSLGRIRAGGVELHLAQGPGSGVHLRGSRPAPATTDSTSTPPWTVSVDSAVVRRLAGSLRGVDDTLPTLRWSEAGLRLSDLRLADGAALALDSAYARLDAPGLAGSEGVGPLELSAAVRLDPGRLQVDTLVVTGPDSRLSGAGTATLPTSVGDAGPLTFDLVADGFPLALVHGALGRRPDPSARLDGTVQLSGTTR
ncbi:MAG: hypothetical protein RLN75_05920, partial [Longimicrobiales bacterium]